MSRPAPVRCFVALHPPPEVVDALVGFGSAAPAGVRWSQPEQLHVTLRFLGEVDPEAAADAVARVRHPAVHVGLGPATEVMFGDVLAVPASGVDHLAAEVRRRTTDLVPDDGRPFVAHLTLGRLRARSARVRPEPVSLGWSAERLALVASRPADGRHVHEVLAEVALGS
jgi:2'-5' RNA ligase